MDQKTRRNPPMKERQVLNLSDLDPSFPDFDFVFWRNPRADTLAPIVAYYEMGHTLLMGQPAPSEAESKRLEEAFHTSVSEIILATGQSGLDFSTPAASRAAFETAEDPQLLYDIIVAFARWLTQFNRPLPAPRRRRFLGGLLR